mmetsp:Transcript_8440/g.24160  ORF Transcript_8440/g.24160 Transcript_8440/m.24160 type:complete len:340 (+) Transcript_8440:87-1106(+)
MAAPAVVGCTTDALPAASDPADVEQAPGAIAEASPVRAVAAAEAAPAVTERMEVVPSGGRPEPAPSQAQLARRHQDEVLLQSFHRWFVLFSLIVCMATPVMLSLLVWLLVALLTSPDGECGVPLKMWVYGVCGIVTFNVTVNHPRPNGSVAQRLLCCWWREPNSPEPLPLRIRAYNCLVALAVFAWNCAGLYWISVDGHVSDPGIPSCREWAPTLYDAVKVNAAFNVTITVFMYINVFGFARLLGVLLRRGLLHTSQAAPPGCLEKSTVVVGMDDPAIAENKSCSICFEDFSRDKTFVKTKACGHVFHKQCLKGWLQVNRTCPLCRDDLAASPTTPRSV